MSDFRIVGISLARDGRASKTGHVNLAFLDVEVGPVLVKGCALVRLFGEPGEAALRLFTPTLSDDNRRGVVFSKGIGIDIRNAAVAMLKAVGGEVG